MSYEHRLKSIETMSSSLFGSVGTGIMLVGRLLASPVKLIWGGRPEYNRRLEMRQEYYESLINALDQVGKVRLILGEVQRIMRDALTENNRVKLDAALLTIDDQERNVRRFLRRNCIEVNVNFEQRRMDLEAAAEASAIASETLVQFFVNALLEQIAEMTSMCGTFVRDEFLGLPIAYSEYMNTCPVCHFEDGIRKYSAQIKRDVYKIRLIQALIIGANSVTRDDLVEAFEVYQNARHYGRLAIRDCQLVRSHYENAKLRAGARAVEGPRESLEELPEELLEEGPRESLEDMC